MMFSLNFNGHCGNEHGMRFAIFTGVHAAGCAPSLM
jgi:hypothetical protein